MEENEQIKLAWDFVNNTNRSIFLTGKAGTGKTTFLHNLKKNSLKQIVVVAPTGVAAINAKGVTIHSFFQLPFGPILPGSDLNKTSGFQRKFSKTKINILKSMDLLIIDEISMVRADVLDGIDNTLRRFRKRDIVFGGVQVLMIGDLQQLSPVIKDNEWQLLKSYYKTGFFFSSLVFQKCQAITIELKHIYRQENPRFIEILNEIRTNTLSEAGAKELNKRYIRDFIPDPKAGYISLTTHNHRAEQTNNAELNALDTKGKTYKAKIDGKFPEHAFPNKEELVLKVGAQVMFVKNDSSQDKRYFNGKIGKVIYLDKDEVTVKCPDDDEPIVTTVELWENINYSVDKNTKAITEERLGSFSQIPLRLAWAITIHKSQGLTFEKAIIDAQGAFAHGQTYVALSRCKSLEGLVLKSKIDSSQVINDAQVTSFSKQAEANQPDAELLEAARAQFQLDCIREIFVFFEFLSPINRLLDVYYKNRNSIEGTIDAPLIAMKSHITNFLKVSNGFGAQLKTFSVLEGLPELSPMIQERFIKAKDYFSSELEIHIGTPFENFNYSTDNKALEKDFIKNLDLLEQLLATKRAYLKSFADGFSAQKFLELRAKAVFLTKTPNKRKRSTAVDGTVNLELFELLRTLRNDIATENDLIHYQVFSQQSLYEICEVLPMTKQQLLDINGFGKVRVEKYGDEILEVIHAYCDENDIEVDVSEEKELKKQSKESTIGPSDEVSLNFYKEGKKIPDIAAERHFAENTIFGHLVKFVGSGEVKLTDLISDAHYQELCAIIPKITFESLTDLKNQVDEKFSYNDLRVVIMALDPEKAKQ